MDPRQKHDSETRKPSPIERRLIRWATECYVGCRQFELTPGQTQRVLMDELEWRLLPVGERPVDAPGEEVIGEQIQCAPF